ncbi:MAG: hypothetical protein ACYS26_05155 [Planctomycetota bacterium]
MKRSTVLLLALALLLAHALTLATDDLGRLGPPSDRAFAAFRIGRNLVWDGRAQFDLGGPFVESYPSWPWIALSAIAERLYWAPTWVAQAVGLISVLATVLVVSRFSPNRLAGVIAPVLTVTSGIIAVAAGNGTELAPLALGACTALLCLESGRTRNYAAVTSLVVLWRDDGIVLAFGLAALAIASRLKPRPQDEGLPPQAQVPLWALALPLGVWLLSALIRLVWIGHLLPPTLAEAATFDAARVRAGWGYLVDFVLRSGAPTLIVLPLVQFPTRALSPRGKRALALGLIWCLWAAWIGGDDLPFFAYLAPAAPLLFIAIQEALIPLVDAKSAPIRQAGWAIFFLACAASALSSKQPTDLGFLRLSSLQRAWQDSEASSLPDSYDVAPQREGQRDRLRRDERLRALGVFLRDEAPVGSRIAALAPGSLAYLTGLPVIDLLGRATPLPGEERSRPWTGPARTDLVRALECDPDYIVPPDVFAERTPSMKDWIEQWLEQYDEVGLTAERQNALAERLAAYELISVPVPIDSKRLDQRHDLPVYLLRHLRAGTRTQVSIELDDAGGFSVRCKHEGHEQVVDVDVVLTDTEGNYWHMRPTGSFVRDKPHSARTNLLLRASGGGLIRLVAGRLPEGKSFRRLQATLRNPYWRTLERPRAVSNTAAVRLRTD